MNSDGRLGGVQVLRGTAALAVLIHHVLEESEVLWPSAVPRWLILVGAAGVDVFFVISGFIMLHTGWDRFGRSGSARSFLARRIERIAPLYWLCCLAVTATALTGMFYQRRPLSPQAVLTSLFLLPTDHLLLGVAWTLQYELYFYLLFALALLVLTARQALVVLPVTFAIGLGFGHLMAAGPVRTFLTNPIVFEFALGMLAARHLSRLRSVGTAARLAVCVGLIAIVAGAIVATETSFLGETPTGGLRAPVRFLVWGVPALLVVFGALTMASASTRRRRALLKLGDASYSIYLTHAIVMTAYARMLKIPQVTVIPSPLLPLAAVVISLAVGLLTYEFVERPLNQWIKRRDASSRRANPAVLA